MFQVSWQMAAMTSTAALRSLKGLANEDRSASENIKLELPPKSLSFTVVEPTRATAQGGRGRAMHSREHHSFRPNVSKPFP